MRMGSRNDGFQVRKTPTRVKAKAKAGDRWKPNIFHQPPAPNESPFDHPWASPAPIPDATQKLREKKIEVTVQQACDLALGVTRTLNESTQKLDGMVDLAGVLLGQVQGAVKDFPGLTTESLPPKEQPDNRSDFIVELNEMEGLSGSLLTIKDSCLERMGPNFIENAREQGFAINVSVTPLAIKP